MNRLLSTLGFVCKLAPQTLTRAISVQPSRSLIQYVSMSTNTKTKANKADKPSPSSSSRLGIGHAFRVVHLAEDAQAYADAHAMTYEEVIHNVGYFRTKLRQLYRERQYGPVIERYIAHRNQEPDSKVVGCLVALRTSGHNLDDVLKTMSDQQIREAAFNHMNRLRSLISFTPARQIEKAIIAGRYVGGGNFSNVALTTQPLGRISFCWGSGGADETSQAHSGHFMLGVAQRGKTVKMSVNCTSSGQLYVVFADAVTLELLREPKSGKILVKYPQHVGLIAKRDAMGRRIATLEAREAAVKALELYMKAEYEKKHRKNDAALQ